AIRAAGGISVVDAGGEWPQINFEEGVKLRPDFLVFASAHAENVLREFAELAEKPAWRQLPAGRDRRVGIISDALHPPPPRLNATIEDLARQLHPQAFPKDPGSGRENPAAARREPAHAGLPLRQRQSPAQFRMSVCAR